MAVATVFFNKSISIIMRVGAMSNVGQFNLVRNDTCPKLKFIIKDCDGNILKPSTDGVSGVNFYLRRSCDDIASNCGHVGTSGLDPENGLWCYSLSAGDISGVGTYFGDLEIIYDNGCSETGFEPIRIYVRDDNKC